ncbi:ribose 1,5-bisphosphokinase [Halomonas piscis]|uniref:Ribose 1,5-bisphosphate phosphokinase PhnN n=1 Tax=Halomonas piscis TaxID=3031727 RepID=A0ABY9YZI9_9GAMM|nr:MULTISPECIES: ribose 1,5-bisphosphokinase [Halomonas]WNK20294.1 ribose 1,5-bisphosphokinase [Halomonas piscis]
MARLVYLMGASGVGKDSLLSAIRQCHPELLVAHRYITRWSGHHENCVSLSAQEFTERRHAGLFCLDWQAHGLEYGIGIEVEHWLKRDHTVIVNGSRRAFARARERFGEQLLPILVTAEPQVLRQRLIQRGRETHFEIERRLAQHQRLEAELVDVERLNNNKALHHSVAALQRLLNTECIS